MSVKSVVGWCAIGVLLTSFVTAETAAPVKRPAVANTTVKGQYKGRKSGQPVPNTLVALCRITGEGECVLSRDLVAVTDRQGRFVVRSVPAGRYTVAHSKEKMPKDVSLAKPLKVMTVQQDPFPSAILKDGTISIFEGRDSKLLAFDIGGNVSEIEVSSYNE